MKVVIVEDRENVKEFISTLVKADTDLKLEGIASSVKEGVETIKRIQPDIVLLDIELPDGRSFDILNNVDYQNFSIIFITSHEDYAIEAFNYSAIDYVLKPIDPEDFYEAINKAKRNQELLDQNTRLQALLYNISNPSNSNKKIILNTTNSVHIVQTNNIIRCESDGSYTIFKLVEDKRIVTSKKLKDYESMLTNLGFVRVHKSHLVNFSKLVSFDKKSNILILQNGDNIPVSVRKREEVLRMIKEI